MFTDRNRMGLHVKIWNKNRIIFCIQNFLLSKFFLVQHKYLNFRYSLYIYTSFKKHWRFSSSPKDGQGRVGWLDSICLFRKITISV